MADDFSQLRKSVYAGRGIGVGRTVSRQEFMAYFVTGRSIPSQARELLYDDGTGIIRTSPITSPERLRNAFKLRDEAELKKIQTEIASGSPPLLYYPAIAVRYDSIVGSNGAQTELLYDQAFRGHWQAIFSHSFEDENRMFSIERNRYDHTFVDKNTGKRGRWISLIMPEPDSPNNTPRISAAIVKGEAGFHTIKYNEFGDVVREPRSIFLVPGMMRMITTYSGGNEKPLKPFSELPIGINIHSKTPQDLVQRIYESIAHGANPDENFAVSAAVVMRSKKGLEFAIFNRFGEPQFSHGVVGQSP